MNLKNFAAIATEVWLNTIVQQTDNLLIEDVWLLQGDFYQGFANALSIGCKWHECTKVELLLLDTVPVLLCSLTVLYLSQLKQNISRSDIESLIESRISSSLKSEVA